VIRPSQNVALLDHNQPTWVAKSMKWGWGRTTSLSSGTNSSRLSSSNLHSRRGGGTWVDAWQPVEAEIRSRAWLLNANLHHHFCIASADHQA
jgi:hypothetical protein